MSQGQWLTLERSLYPLSMMFKPVESKLTSVRQIHAEFIRLLAQEIPLTAEEKNRSWPPTKGSYLDGFDCKELDQWKQVGIYWVRQTQGPNPHCWTDSRIGAHALWRDAVNSYSCAGFPSFYPETMEKFRHEFEMVKPVLSCPRFIGGRLLISLQRELEGPVGTCWGIRTARTFWRVECNGRTELTASKAGLMRCLKSLSDGGGHIKWHEGDIEKVRTED